MKIKGVVFGIITLLFVMGVASAQSVPFTHVISNSEDWRDVYSIMHYATLKGVGKDFLVSPQHGPVLLNGINKENDILVISSQTLPFTFNYQGIVAGQGFRSVDEIVVSNANLELIEDLPEVTNFVIVGDSYGYNSIAVAPYAVSKKAWVFFANEVTIDEIELILATRTVDELLIYGFVEPEVRDALAQFNPDIIDTGDRFNDNVAIVKRQSGERGPQQILLTNGEFIEAELMSGSYPILFTGKESVPEQIGTFIRNSDIEVGVLIGADLVGAATNIRRDTGISVIVKFARGARNPTGALAAVEGLDLFYLPIPIYELAIHSAQYNSATSQLELTYLSNSNVPVFFKGTITPVGSGEATRIGDVDPIFIAPNDFKTVAYPDFAYTEEGLEIDVFTLYGGTPTALEKILEQRVMVEQVNIIDGCTIKPLGVEYRKPKDSFAVVVENTGDVNCWVDVELPDILVDGNREILGSDGSVFIESGDTERIYVQQVMSDIDLAQNNLVEVIGYYGEREDSLVKVIRGTFPLKIITVSLATIGLIALIVIVVIALVIFLFMFVKRRREEDDFDDY